MATIKNNRTDYVKRSHKASRRMVGEGLRTSAAREQEFLVAEIDQGFYMDFRTGLATERDN
jgi:hypothetical protein